MTYKSPEYKIYYLKHEMENLKDDDDADFEGVKLS
jgi:hypothetical protein